MRRIHKSHVKLQMTHRSAIGIDFLLNDTEEFSSNYQPFSLQFDNQYS